MRFDGAQRRPRRRIPIPRWMSQVGPTVAVMIGTSLVITAPVVVMARGKHLALVAIAGGFPLLLLLALGVWLSLTAQQGAGPSDGGGGPPPPPDRPSDEPPWWPAFEESFRQHVVALSDSAAATTTGDNAAAARGARQRVPVGSTPDHR